MIKQNLVKGGSIMIGQLVTSFIHVSQAQAKIRLKDDEMENVLNEIFHYLSIFNNNNIINRYTTCLNGISLSNIPILDEFKDFILPTEVRFDANSLQSLNLMLNEDVDDWRENDSIDRFVQLEERFRSMFKSSLREGTVPLSELKKAVTLSDVIDRVAVNTEHASGMLVWKCHYTDKPFIPIKVKGLLSLYDPTYFNVNVDDVLREYCMNVRL